MDVVYVDGDHSYEGAASDLKAWWPILRQGGAMVGHAAWRVLGAQLLRVDYTITWPGVVRAVNEFADAHGLDVNFSAELWWFLKPGDSVHSSTLQRCKCRVPEPIASKTPRRKNAHFSTLLFLDVAAKVALSISSAGEKGLNPEELQEAFAQAEELSYGQEATVEAEHGPIFLSAAPSGASLGGSFWSLEALGIRLAVLGAACALSVPVSQGLETEVLRKAEVVVCPCLAKEGEGAEVRASLPEVSHQAAAVLGRGGNVLIPIGADQAFTEDLVMSISRQISDLPDKCQGPIFACGAPALRLRRCGVFAEFSSKTCLDRAHSGEHPFLVDALRDSGRLVLADSLSEMAESYQEPCVLLVPGSLAQGFDGRWASNPESRLLQSDLFMEGCQLPCIGKPLRRRLTGSELRRWATGRLLLTRSDVELLGISSMQKAGKSPLVLPPAEFLDVPVDLSVARVQCWLPEDQLARVQQGKRSAGDLLEGALVGRRRPRISSLVSRAAPAVEMSKEAIKMGFQARGIEVEVREGADGKGTEMQVPSLNARIVLNYPASDQSTALETIVECTSAQGRRQILEVLNAELG
ncbi:unnamed protein product [Symbiodinium microadriaticum]|nr:unnamed protein product [Symbiodinium microadriaticum]